MVAKPKPAKPGTTAKKRRKKPTRQEKQAAKVELPELPDLSTIKPGVQVMLRTEYKIHPAKLGELYRQMTGAFNANRNAMGTFALAICIDKGNFNFDIPFLVEYGIVNVRDDNTHEVTRDMENVIKSSVIFEFNGEAKGGIHQWAMRYRSPLAADSGDMLSKSEIEQKIG